MLMLEPFLIYRFKVTDPIINLWILKSSLMCSGALHVNFFQEQAVNKLALK